MKATFLTTDTSDVDKLVGAWDCQSDTPAERFAWNYYRSFDAPTIRHQIEHSAPDVIFYVGPAHAHHWPHPAWLHDLRETVAPIVHICCDAGDPPWHNKLREYAEQQSFSKQVSIDGYRGDAPVDLVTLTPVDLRPFRGEPAPDRKIRFGFAGNTQSGHRKHLVQACIDLAGLRHRERDGESYEVFARWLRRCKLVLNSAITGTGTRMHVKGRVLEAGFAHAAVMEMRGAPTAEWFPENAVLYYGTPEEACEIVRNISDAELKQYADALQAHCYDNYHPAAIYRQMLEGIEHGTRNAEAA